VGIAVDKYWLPIVFLRSFEDEHVLLALNRSDEEIDLYLDLPRQTGKFRDVLNSDQSFTIENSRVNRKFSPWWGRIFVYSAEQNTPKLAARIEIFKVLFLYSKA